MRYLMLAGAIIAFIYAVLMFAYGKTEVTRAMAAIGFFSGFILLGLQAVLARLDRR